MECGCTILLDPRIPHHAVSITLRRKSKTKHLREARLSQKLCVARARNGKPWEDAQDWKKKCRTLGPSHTHAYTGSLLNSCPKHSLLHAPVDVSAGSTAPPGTPSLEHLLCSLCPSEEAEAFHLAPTASATPSPCSFVATLPWTSSSNQVLISHIHINRECPSPALKACSRRHLLPDTFPIPLSASNNMTPDTCLTFPKTLKAPNSLFRIVYIWIT